MPGYSGAPLAKKLGFGKSCRVRVVNPPEHYRQLLEPLPAGVTISNRLQKNIDCWHMFVDARDELPAGLRRAMKTIPADGFIWVSWPKKASGVVTDMSEDEVRDAALPLGLVDIKVCSVDETWSALKLVIRKSNR